MTEVIIKKDFAFSAQQVWTMLANFGDISWAPGMERVEVIGEGVGMTRRIFMPDMEPIDEVMQSIDHEAMTLRYTIPRGNPMPVVDYVAGPTVISTGPDSCRVEWLGQFEATAGASESDAADAVKGIYTMMLEWLDEALQAKAA